MSAAVEAKSSTNGTVPSESLTAKLVGAALEVENVPKAGRNDQQKYNYARAEDIVAAATKALLSRRILADFEPVDSTAHPIKSRQGSDGLIVTVRCRLIVTDSETGEVLTREAMGSGSDYPGDKAIYKAMTGARKYAFMHLLDIPIGDDPDAHRGEQTNGTTKAKAAELPPEQVERIKAGFKGRSWKEIELVMGSVGADAPKVRRTDSLTKAVREMDPAHAEALEKVLASA